MRTNYLQNIAATVVVACSLTLSGPAVRGQEKPAAKHSAVPLFEGLGPHRRPVTTGSAQAQKYFDQGLNFLFAFNHDEAIRSFRQATTLDPNCAMAWWGIAVANGPNINNPVVTAEQSKLAWESLTRARSAASGASAVEQALIAALAARYADPQPEDRNPLDAAYAAAMRRVWHKYPDDADVGALFAESLMDLRPWDLWTSDRQPQPGTAEVIATLEATLTQQPEHPLGLHLYIHALEASPQPQKAVAPANRLRKLQPGLGHMVHMPSHIDVRTGQWALALESNDQAIAADRRYRLISPQQGFYRIYMAHNHHMLAYAAMMRGQSRRAISAIREMSETMPADWIKENAPIADGFAALPIEVLVRFGRWEEVLSTPEPPEYLPFTRALRHAARGIASAATEKLEQARADQQAFLAARKQVSAEARVGNNAAHDVLNVAEHLLAGEILVRAGQSDAGLDELRTAVKAEDLLRYSEPPDWIHPVRHALGATLLTLDRPAEAEEVYREDLARLPHNGWSLFGLGRALRQQGKTTAADQWNIQFEAAWRDADIKITSSCFCQPVKE